MKTTDIEPIIDADEKQATELALRIADRRRQIEEELEAIIEA